MQHLLSLWMLNCDFLILSFLLHVLIVILLWGRALLHLLLYILLYICMITESWICIIIICFVAQTIPTLAIRSSFRLAPVFFHPASSLFFFFFWLCCASRGILVPHQEIDPRPLPAKVQSLTHWTAREFTPSPRFKSISLLFASTRCFRFILYFPCLIATISHFSKKSESSYWRMVLVTKL